MKARLRLNAIGTLRSQLTVGVALVHAVMMLLFLWDLTTRQQHMILEQQTEQAMSLSQTLAVSSSGWLAAHDLAGLQELADAQKRYPELSFAMLLAPDGRVLAHSDRTKLGLFLHDLPEVSRQTVLHTTSALVDVVTPVELAGQSIGWARVGIGQKVASQKLASITRDGLLYAAAAIVIGSLIAWWMAAVITRRLSTIQHAIDKIKQGETSARIQLKGSDEAARLAGEFNAMLDALEQREQKRKIAEEQLQDSEAFLRNVVENIPAMIFIKDAKELRFVSLNREAENVLGISRDEMIGKNDYDFFPAEQAGHFVRRDRIALSPGAGVDVQEETIQTRDGHKELLTRKIAIRNAKGEARYLLGISEDITRQKQAARALVEAKEMAEATSRAKTAFLNMVSHEMRTPLNGVMGGVQLLQMTRLDDEQLEYLGIVNKSAVKELELITELLDLTGIEAGMLAVGHEPFSLRTVLESAVSAQQTAGMTKGVPLFLSVQEKLPDRLIGDGSKIEQALRLLLDNAIKFTSEGRIDVAVTALEQNGSSLRLLLTVSDTGVGIASDVQDTIFEPFMQADMSNTRGFGGVGVGLTLCRRLIERMGGTIGVTSSPRMGSRFSVELPLQMTADGDRQIPPPDTCPQELRVTTPLTVLIAEDNDANLKAQAGLVSKLGLKAVCAEDGRVALAKWEAGGIDVILMDIEMPVMNGREATRCIRQQEQGGIRHTPIIALTAHAMTGDREKLLGEGFDGYVAKPFQLHELAVELERVTKRV